MNDIPATRLIPRHSMLSEKYNYFEKPGSEKFLWANYPDNNLLEANLNREVNYADGRLNGHCTITGPENQIFQEAFYKQGVLDGSFRTYYPNGQKAQETNYKNGLPDGLHTIWDSSGDKVEETNYKNGLKDGFVREWIGDFLYAEQSYKNGKLHGVSKKWHPDPNIEKALTLEETHYEDGVKSGFETLWNLEPYGKALYCHHYVNQPFVDECVEVTEELRRIQWGDNAKAVLGIKIRDQETLRKHQLTQLQKVIFK